MTAATVPLLDAALHYRQLWGAPVIPVNDHKQPLCDWGQWRYGGQTESAVTELFSRPSYGLALLLWPASALVVIDRDGPHAEQTWLSTGIVTPQTARVYTPHGVHDYYRMPPGVDCDEVDRKVRIVTARECGCVKPCGVDILVKGYTVAPPTPRYREDPDCLLEPSMIACLPNAVLDLMRHATADDNDHGFTVGEKINDGERNSTLYRMARSLKAKGLSFPAILAALKAENEARCQPPLAAEEVEQIARHAFEQPDRPAFAANDNGDASTGEPQAKGSGDALDLSEAVVDYREMLSLELPERRRYLAWLAEKSIALIFGERGVGKTMLGLSLATSLPTGHDFLKWPVSEPVGVLYVDGEMALEELRTRATALLTEPPTAPLMFLTAELMFHKLNRDLTLTDDATRVAVTQILEANPAIRVVIFDNISSLFNGIDEDSKRAWEPIAAWLVKLRHRGLATVLVHHSGKGGQQRGTSGREDAVNTVIKLERPAGYDAREGCRFELRFTKSRSVKGEEVAPLDVRLGEQSGRLTWTYTTLEESKLDQVKALLADGETSVSNIAEELGISKGYASKLLRKARGGQ
jgi:putative DNA primase/helicase